MKQEFIELAKYRIQESRKTLSDARVLFENGSFRSSVNRLYYSLFYAVNAVLICSGLSSSKHSGVRSLFNKEFVGKSIVKIAFGKFYNQMFNLRQAGDYMDYVTFDKNEISGWLIRTEEFIDVMDALVNEKINGG